MRLAVGRTQTVWSVTAALYRILRMIQGGIIERDLPVQYNDQLGTNVLNQICSMPFWGDFENRVAVAIVGSVGAGLGDEHSDLDVYILVPEKDSKPLYEICKKGYEEGTIEVLNPRAFQFDNLDVSGSCLVVPETAHHLPWEPR